MRNVMILPFLIIYISSYEQGINQQLSAQMTIEKAGTFNNQNQLQKVFAINNYSDTSHGSGFLIKGGYILTNWHVIKGADPDQIKVVSSNGIVEDIKYIVSDSLRDLAVLKPYATLKDGFQFEEDDSILVGNQIYTWGFPFQYGPTALLSVGYIAGFRAFKPDDKKPSQIVNHILFNGAFNPGNSGGAIIDGKGKIVGIVQSKAVPLPDLAIEGLNALQANNSGFNYTKTDSKGNRTNMSEAQVIAMILNSFREIAQVMIGEGVTVMEIKDFLHQNKISGY